MMTVFSIGYQKDRAAGARYVNQFIEEMKKSGFIRQAIERANIKGAVVAQIGWIFAFTRILLFYLVDLRPDHWGGDGRSKRRLPKTGRRASQQRNADAER